MLLPVIISLVRLTKIMSVLSGSALSLRASSDVVKVREPLGETTAFRAGTLQPRKKVVC